MKKLIGALIAGAVLLSATSAMAQNLGQGNLTHNHCNTYKNNGTAFNAYPSALNTKLDFLTITAITGTIYGQNWKTGLPEQRALNAATDWHNGGYLGGSFGTTGGWGSAFFYSGGTGIANGKDLIDVRFGAQDGLSPGKAKSPTGTQHLYIVQRNRDMAKKNDGMTLAGFDLKICGMVNGPPDE